LIDLSHIQGRSAIALLEQYNGINPYIKKLKIDYLKNNKLALTDNQTKYIIANFDRQPQFLNRIVNITPYLAEELKKIDNLNNTPQKVLIEFMLSDNDKSYHIYGKLFKIQKESKMYWLPKTQVLDDPYFEPITVDVDFTPYNKILSKQNKTLYKHQEEGVKFLLSRNGCILADDMGLGKGLIISTLAITPKGKVKFGDLKVGDQIIGSNGKACNIIGVYPQG